MARIGIVDTTLRDGHQCLWATRMSTPMMEPVLEAMDVAGFDAIELFGAVQFDSCVRFLGENPWDRMRLFRKRIAQTKRQAIVRSKCVLGFDLQPDDVNLLWYERLVLGGMERFIAFDGLHDLDNLEAGLKHAKALGAETQGWLIFSESPIHTDALYAAKAREFIERCQVDTVMIEDTSGILTPERAATLIPAVRRAIGHRPLGLHTHNLLGLGQLLYIEAAKQGVETLYTCVAPLADGNAPPAVQTTARNLRHFGHTLDVDDGAIAAVARDIEKVAVRERKPRGRPQDFDAASFDHQIPGGVLSNLQSQLDAAGLADRLPAVLEECGRIRAETGWPIMVTPFSQFVGVQATLNVLTGERYARVPDEMKKYCLGYYGRLPAPVDGNVLDRIVENGSRTIALERPERPPALPALHRRYPKAGEEELLLRHSFKEEVVEAMFAARSGTPEISTNVPLAHLVEQIAMRPGISHFFLQKGDLTIEIAGAEEVSPAAR